MKSMQNTRFPCTLENLENWKRNFQAWKSPGKKKKMKMSWKILEMVWKTLLIRFCPIYSNSLPKRALSSFKISEFEALGSENANVTERDGVMVGFCLLDIRTGCKFVEQTLSTTHTHAQTRFWNRWHTTFGMLCCLRSSTIVSITKTLKTMHRSKTWDNRTLNLVQC